MRDNCFALALLAGAALMVPGHCEAQVSWLIDAARAIFRGEAGAASVAANLSQEEIAVRLLNDARFRDAALADLGQIQPALAERFSEDFSKLTPAQLSSLTSSLERAGPLPLEIPSTGGIYAAVDRGAAEQDRQFEEQLVQATRRAAAEEIKPEQLSPSVEHAAHETSAAGGPTGDDALEQVQEVFQRAAQDALRPTPAGKAPLARASLSQQVASANRRQKRWVLSYDPNADRITVRAFQVGSVRVTRFHIEEVSEKLHRITDKAKKYLYAAVGAGGGYVAGERLGGTSDDADNGAPVARPPSTSGKSPDTSD